MARRYRPANFSEVIGQEHVARTLKNALEAGRVAHAYLFCGPHGCGKTSMARIFARALVCPTPKGTEPCGECSLCRDVMRGQDVDVREIDGASNNGVENVRQLREQAAYIPTRAKYKIYIIDEVHMLSVPAFNALLKTLEEPPAHVKFILATTDPHKLSETVLSRVQRFDFRLVAPARLAEFFKDLAAREKVAVSAEALDAVAAFAGGSVRDGLVLLDQLLSYARGEVTREDVERVRGVASAEAVSGLFAKIHAHDLPGALGVVDEVAQCGVTVGDYLDQLIEFGRDLMLVAATKKAEGISAYGPARACLLELAQSVSLDQILLWLDVLVQARTRVRMRALTNPLVPLEMAIARLAGLDELTSVSALAQTLEALASGAPPPRPAPRPDPVPSRPPAPIPAPRPQEQIRPAPPAESPAPETPPWSVPAASPVAPEPIRPAASASEMPAAAKPAETTAPDNSPTTAPEPADEPEPAAPAHQPSAPAAAVTPPPAAAPVRVEAASAAPENAEAYADEGADDEDENDVSPAETGGGWAGGYAPSAPGLAEARKLWPAILAEIRKLHAPDLAFLHDVAVEDFSAGRLRLAVPGGGTFIFEQLEDPHRKQRLAQAAEAILGQPVAVQLTMRETTPVVPAGSPAPARRGPIRDRAAADPAVRLVVDRFGGQLLNIIDETTE